MTVSDVRRHVAFLESLHDDELIRKLDRALLSSAVARCELRGRKIYWGVDNNTALSAALHGYAPSQSMKPLVNAVHIAMAHLSTRHPLRVRAERR